YCRAQECDGARGREGSDLRDDQARPAEPPRPEGDAILLPQERRDGRLHLKVRPGSGPSGPGRHSALIGSEPVSFSVSSTIAVLTCCTDSCGRSTPLTKSDRDFRSGVTTFNM